MRGDTAQSAGTRGLLCKRTARLKLFKPDVGCPENLEAVLRKLNAIPLALPDGQVDIREDLLIGSTVIEMSSSLSASSAVAAGSSRSSVFHEPLVRCS